MTYQVRNIGKTYQFRNIGIAAALAICAALLAAYFVKSAQDDTASGNALTGVMVASGDIAAGTPGSELANGRHLERRELPRDSVIPGAIASPSQVAGLVATDTIYAGEQITVRRFTPLAEQGILADLSGNMRAFQVPGTQHQLLAGTLKEGDHVDLVASVKYQPRDLSGAGAGIDNNVASRIVLRDLLVLRAAEDPGDSSGISSSVAPTLSVTLAVTDRQSQKLFWVMTNGEWSLQLRPLNKPKDSPESVVTVTSVLTDGLHTAQRSAFATGR
jgi:pilus assembly protein CpaB